MSQQDVHWTRTELRHRIVQRRADILEQPIEGIGCATTPRRVTVTGQVECRVRLKDLMAGDMTQNINVYPGDVLVVPETRF